MVSLAQGLGDSVMCKGHWQVKVVNSQILGKNGTAGWGIHTRGSDTGQRQTYYQEVRLQERQSRAPWGIQDKQSYLQVLRVINNRRSRRKYREKINA